MKAPRVEPDPPSQSCGAAGLTSQGGGAKQDLTAHVRDLYENSAVPMQEIARIAGVSERTIYKYARKGGWKPRHRWNSEGTRPEAFAPAKGLSGRFIRRDDIGKPFPSGLKALDPVGRSRALGASGKARRLSQAAQQTAEIEAFRAELLRDAESRAGIVRHMVRYLSEMRKLEAALRKREAALKPREAEAEEISPEALRDVLARRLTNMMESRFDALAAEKEPSKEP